MDALLAHQCKERTSKNMAQRVQAPSYNMGDFVWLDCNAFQDLARGKSSKKKFIRKRFGLSQILELIQRNALWLELSSSLKVHPLIRLGMLTILLLLLHNQMILYIIPLLLMIWIWVNVRKRWLNSTQFLDTKRCLPVITNLILKKSRQANEA